MKAIKLITSVFIIIWAMAILSGCTKEGAVGPRGELGEDGSTILSGSAAPDPAAGKIGDYYFRISNNDFYGPKTANGWGKAANLKGAPGAEGSAILSGTVAPGTALGANGDFYFRINTGDFYGPKSNAGWGTPVNLKGSAGPKGEDGATIISGAAAPTNGIGTTGDFYFQVLTGNFYGPKTAAGWGTPTNLKGANGAAGAAGSQIISGTGAPGTALGASGDFYFRINTGDFYGPKSNAGWGTPVNLKGSTGPKGEDGATIISGAAAPTNGIGTPGDFYFQVLTGNFYGPKTAAGWGTPTNLKGANGAAGAAGSQIISGTGAPGTALGRTGDFYFNRSTADFYGPKNGSNWGSPINLKGPAGPPGTANVIYSDWMDMSVDSGVIKIPAKELTQAILDGGHVAVYAKEYKGNTLLGLNQLPFTSRHTGTLLEFKLGLNQITVYSTVSALSNYDTKFRYIIIPGGIFSPDTRSQLQDYNLVKRMYNIPD